MRRFIVLAALLTLAQTFAYAQQQPDAQTTKPSVHLGHGMNLIAPGLMQLAMESSFFLAIADEIGLTKEQRATLEDLFFDFQKFSVQRLADLSVANAELERLLTREQIDLDAVGTKVKESEAINSAVRLRRIESLIKAVGILTHEQHLGILKLVQKTQPSQRPDQAEPKLRM